MRNGTTLIELAAVLALLGVLTGLMSPVVSGVRDRAVVLEARERFVALVVDARRVAGERAGATLIVRSDPGEVLLVATGDTVRTMRWPDRTGAPRISIGGARRTIELVFDRAGVGRFASAAVDFQRGDTSSRLIVSSYGRVRRQ